MERIIREEVQTFIEERDLLASSQHGFRNSRSTLSQLLEHQDNILNVLIQGDNLDVLYLDYAKAFDSLKFKKIKEKLKEFGVQGKGGNLDVHLCLHEKAAGVV